MGQDKALLPFLGIPLIERLRDRFLALECKLGVICNDRSRYEHLGLPLFEDVIPDRGALGGLFSALTVSETSLLGLIAADMPFANPTLVTSLMEQLQQTGADAALPSTKKGLEPLHGVYRVNTCLPFVQEAITNDLWRMNAWHDQARIHVVDPVETVKISGTEYTFVNVNTPDDLSRAEELAVTYNLL
jgi:molybdopterin-guanine dinucleotide biosynthesis protein A